MCPAVSLLELAERLRLAQGSSWPRLTGVTVQTPPHCQNLGLIPTTVCLFIFSKTVVCKVLQALIFL